MTRGHRATFRRLAKVAALAPKRKYTRRVAARLELQRVLKERRSSARGARGRGEKRHSARPKPSFLNDDILRPTQLVPGGHSRRKIHAARCWRVLEGLPRLHGETLGVPRGSINPSIRNPCSPQPQVCPDPNHHLPVSDPKGRASCPTLRSGHRIPILTLPYHFFHSIPAFSQRIE